MGLIEKADLENLLNCLKNMDVCPQSDVLWNHIKDGVYWMKRDNESHENG